MTKKNTFLSFYLIMRTVKLFINFVYYFQILRSVAFTRRDENGERRRLHHEELHDWYRSPDIARVIKSRRMRWADHVARMEEGMNAFQILTVTPAGKRP